MTGRTQGERGADDRSSFGRNATFMVGGTIASQVIAILVMPVLTRVLSPQAVGLQALFVSIAGLLVVLATLRLDLAIVLAADRDHMLRLVGLIFYQALALSLVVAAVALVAAPEMASRAAPDVASDVWIWLLPPMILLSSSVQAGIGVVTRTGRFGALALTNVSISASFAGVAVLAGIVSDSDVGAVWARLFGQVVGLTVLILVGGLAIGQGIRRWSAQGARREWSHQRQFLRFNTPYSLIGTFTRDLPLFVFSVGAGTALAAAYALARLVTLAPTSFISASLSSVFFREASRHLGEPRLERLALELTRWGMMLSFPAFALMFVWGDRLFEFVFGAGWADAGRFAQLLAIPLWLALQSGWPGRLFEAANKQHISFAIQLGFDLAHVLVLISVFWVTRNAMATVASYSVTLSAFYLTYLVSVYRVAGFSLTPLMRMFAVASIGFACTAGCLILLRQFSGLADLTAMITAVGGVLLSTGLILVALRWQRERNKVAMD